MKYYDVNTHNYPPEVVKYVTQTPIELEIVPWYLFETQQFQNTWNHKIFFFDQVRYNKPDESDNNLWVPGMLPNPCAFLLEAIRIFGLPTSLQHARLRLEIGNKLMSDTSVLAYIYNQWKIRDIPIFIPPLCNFRAQMTWKMPKLIHGRLPLITIMFKGQLIRSVQ